MKVLEAEKKVGIETFFTPFEGVGGKLRSQPEDFMVSEVSNYPPKSVTGKYLIADVTTKNWETNLLVRELSNSLHISRQRISFAGTKDKRAKSTRLMSIYGVSAERLSKVNIKNVTIENIYSSESSVKIGNLLGNRFEIIVRNIDKNIDIKSIRNVSTFFEKYGGFPNFYGIQRFGIIRPITHIVGKYIVKDDFENAAMTYIGNPIEGEDKDSFMLRERLEKTRTHRLQSR